MAFQQVRCFQYQAVDVTPGRIYEIGFSATQQTGADQHMEMYWYDGAATPGFDLTNSPPYTVPDAGLDSDDLCTRMYQINYNASVPNWQDFSNKRVKPSQNKMTVAIYYADQWGSSPSTWHVDEIFARDVDTSNPLTTPTPGGVVAGNVLVNPGAETGDFGGWSWAGNNFPLLDSALGMPSPANHSGSHRFSWISSGSDASEGYLYQTVPVTAGHTYRATAWYTKQDAVNGYFTMFYTQGDVNATKNQLADSGATSKSAWTQMTNTFLASGSQVTLILRFRKNWATGLEVINVDDVSLVDQSVPQPTFTNTNTPLPASSTPTLAPPSSTSTPTQTNTPVNTPTPPSVGSGTRQTDGSYSPGGQETITLTFPYTGTLSALGIQETLPVGWSFVSLQSGNPAVAPTAGTTGVLDFAWINAPASPVTLTYIIKAPEGSCSGAATITGKVEYRKSDSGELIELFPDSTLQCVVGPTSTPTVQPTPTTPPTGDGARTTDGGFNPGGQETITVNFPYTGQILALGITETIPNGWTLVSIQGTAPPIAPSIGATGELSFAWVTTPASPVTVTYVIQAPAGTCSGNVVISGKVEYRRGGGPIVETIPASTLICQSATPTSPPAVTSTPTQVSTNTPAVVNTNTPTSANTNTPQPAGTSTPTDTATPLPCMTRMNGDLDDNCWVNQTDLLNLINNWHKRVE